MQKQKLLSPVRYLFSKSSHNSSKMSKFANIWSENNPREDFFLEGCKKDYKICPIFSTFFIPIANRGRAVLTNITISGSQDLREGHMPKKSNSQPYYSSIKSVSCLKIQNIGIYLCKSEN